MTGLIISPNKTLQGIYDLQVWEPSGRPTRRAMHTGVFEAGWDDDQLMRLHRIKVAKEQRNGGRQVISLDWTFAHHERGPEIFANTRTWDYVENRMAQLQTVVTAVISNRQRIDGLEVVVQEPSRRQEELNYLNHTAREAYEEMEEAQTRILELLYHFLHNKQYRKRTEIAVDLVRTIEEEGRFPRAHYAFDNGVLTLELTRLIESCKKQWVSELEGSRLIQWKGEWKSVQGIASELRSQHLEAFRPVMVRLRNGEKKLRYAFTKVVRLKKYGRKRLVIAHEEETLQDEPRFLLTDALHWESKRVIETWSYRWGSEIFHEFGKQVTGLESSQVRKEEAVKRHFRLSCVAQSLLQGVTAVASKSERFEFAKGQITFGQRVRTVAREVFGCLLKRAKQLFDQGESWTHVLEALMPA
ncbi:MAG: hypothetical protein AABZ61_07620 [Bacteroidota bacterium]